MKVRWARHRSRAPWFGHAAGTRPAARLSCHAWSPYLAYPSGTGCLGSSIAGRPIRCAQHLAIHTATSREVKRGSRGRVVIDANRSGGHVRFAIAASRSRGRPVDAERRARRAGRTDKLLEHIDCPSSRQAIVILIAVYSGGTALLARGPDCEYIARSSH
jgi:hypothetical protein